MLHSWVNLIEMCMKYCGSCKILIRFLLDSCYIVYLVNLIKIYIKSCGSCKIFWWFNWKFGNTSRHSRSHSGKLFRKRKISFGRWKLILQNSHSYRINSSLTEFKELRICLFTWLNFPFLYKITLKMSKVATLLVFNVQPCQLQPFFLCTKNFWFLTLKQFRLLVAAKFCINLCSLLFNHLFHGWGVGIKDQQALFSPVNSFFSHQSALQQILVDWMLNKFQNLTNRRFDIVNQIFVIHDENRSAEIPSPR